MHVIYELMMVARATMLVVANNIWIGRETYRCEDSPTQTNEIGEESMILGD